MKVNHILFTLFLFLALLGTFTIAKAQCSFENIVPVKVGMTKFEARNKMNSQSATYIPFPDWEPTYFKPLYLKGDSVKKESLSYNVKTNPCLKGRNIYLLLTFTDNILYRIELKAEFLENEYNSCYNQYQNITSELDKLFSNFKSKYEMTVKNEKMGEGYGYRIQNNDKELRESNFFIGNKMNEISIGYKFKGILTPYLYVLEYEQINLFLTKMDGRGY